MRLCLEAEEDAGATRTSTGTHSDGGRRRDWALGQQRVKRLEAWRRERAPHVGADDRIIRWIDQELARLSAPAWKPEPSILVKVRLARNDVRKLDRRPAPVERMLRLAWLCKLPEPESMPLDELKTTLEARGYALDAIAQAQPAAPRPPRCRWHPSQSRRWLAGLAGRHRAGHRSRPPLHRRLPRTPCSPTLGAGQPVSAMGLSTAVSELKRLLDLDPGPATDPLTDKLKSVGARGRIGAAVTRLEIQPDMSAVTVEATLWVRKGQQWLVFGSRNAVVRPDDLPREAGKDLARRPAGQRRPSRSWNCSAWGQFPPTSKSVACASALPPKERSAWLALRSIKILMTWHYRFWNVTAPLDDSGRRGLGAQGPAPQASRRRGAVRAPPGPIRPGPRFELDKSRAHCDRLAVRLHVHGLPGLAWGSTAPGLARILSR